MSLFGGDNDGCPGRYIYVVKKTVNFKTQDGREVAFMLSSVYRIEGLAEDWDAVVDMHLYWDCDFDGSGKSEKFVVDEVQYQKVIEAWTKYMESSEDE